MKQMLDAANAAGTARIAVAHQRVEVAGLAERDRGMYPCGWWTGNGDTTVNPTFATSISHKAWRPPESSL